MHLGISPCNDQSKCIWLERFIFPSVILKMQSEINNNNVDDIQEIGLLCSKRKFVKQIILYCVWIEMMNGWKWSC